MKRPDGDLAKRIGVRVRALREMKGLTLQKLADEVGLTKMSLANIEWGHREPMLSNLLKIVRYFGVSLDDMVRTSKARKEG